MHIPKMQEACLIIWLDGKTMDWGFLSEAGGFLDPLLSSGLNGVLTSLAMVSTLENPTHHDWQLGKRVQPPLSHTSLSVPTEP